MTIGVNLRDQRRLTLVIESAYHLCCGDFQDFLQSISSDGISRNRGGAEGEIWLESGSGQHFFHILKFLHCSLAMASAILTRNRGGAEGEIWLESHFEIFALQSCNGQCNSYRRSWSLGFDHVSGEISFGCVHDAPQAAAMGKLARASSALHWLLGFFIPTARGVGPYSAC